MRQKKILSDVAKREIAKMRGILRGESEAPCDNCVHAARCCSLRMSCAAYDTFIDGNPWRSIQRTPTPKRFTCEQITDDFGKPFIEQIIRNHIAANHPLHRKWA